MSASDTGVDAALKLRDRQVIDHDGLMVCKVDDVELTAVHDGLQVTSLLSGPPALLPRFAGRLGNTLLEQWRRLAPEQPDRDVPWRIDLRLVDRIDNAVHLSVGRDELLTKVVAASRTHRLNDLVGASVALHGEPVGRVLDVRLAPWMHQPVIDCTSLIVGRGRPGAMLGYDRGPSMGPAVISHAIRWLHRHTGLVDLSDVARLDWDGRQVEITRGLRELVPASA
jgi:sporulation protein YlmC with PRC-barrel domain